MQAALFDAGVELTVRNLFAAYQGELSTQANYLAFAKQADSDGYHGIASLFRAAARAEQIHANNQARVLRQMGAEASANIEVSAVRSTLENLRSALRRDLRDRHTLSELYRSSHRKDQFNGSAFLRLGVGGREDACPALHGGDRPGRSRGPGIVDRQPTQLLCLPGLCMHIARQDGKLHDLQLPI